LNLFQITNRSISFLHAAITSFL